MDISCVDLSHMDSRNGLRLRLNIATGSMTPPVAPQGALAMSSVTFAQTVSPQLELSGNFELAGGNRGARESFFQRGLNAC